MRIFSLLVSFFLVAFFNQAFIFAAPLGSNYPRAPGISAADARQKVIEASKKYL